MRGPRLDLLRCDLAHFQAYAHGPAELAELLRVEVAPAWPVFAEAMPHAHERLRQEPGLAGWWTYLFILREGELLVGNGGYKGPPADGVVEIGYAIAPGWRGRGLATEAAGLLIGRAFADPRVQAVRAHTLVTAGAAARVVEKVGLKRVATLQDPDDGRVWRWQVARQAWPPPGLAPPTAEDVPDDLAS